jgi:outer membrane protein assembly factor BamB
MAGGLLLVPAWNGTLYALDPQRGELLWQYDGHLSLRAAPLVTRERVYLAAGDGTLSALTLGGELLWKRDCGRPLLTSPAFLPGGPVVLGKDGTLVAFDPSGKKRWSLPLDETCFYGSPVVVGEALFVATAGGGLWKIDGREGRVIWRQPLSGPGYATPLWHDGDLYVGDNAGTLQVFGADSGALRGTWRATGPIQAAPVFSAGRLLIGSRDGRLYALEVEKRISDAHDQQ